MNLPKFALSGVRRVLPALLLGSVAVSLSAWAGPKQVPFKARITAQETFGEEDPVRCPGTFAVGNTTGKGTASHMGAVRMEATDCPVFELYEVPEVPEGYILIPTSFKSGVLTLTAANGDEVHATYKGDLTPVDIAAGIYSIVGTYTVNPDNGTGRFKKATGSGTLGGTITVYGLWASAEYEVKGTISYSRD